MALVNVLAIVQLTPTAVVLSKNYWAKLASDQAPEYKSGDVNVQGNTVPGSVNNPKSLL